MGSASNSGYARSNSTAFSMDASGSSVQRIGRGGASGTWWTTTGPPPLGRSSTQSREEASAVTASALSSSSCLPDCSRRCARHCASDQSSTSWGAGGGGSEAPPSFGEPPPTGSAHRSVPPLAGAWGAADAQACARKSASSPTVTGIPMGIFSRSCIGMDERCIPHPSSGCVHCLLIAEPLTSAPSCIAAVAAEEAAAFDSEALWTSPLISNSQTSASTLLGSAGATMPQATGGRAASSLAPWPSRRICEPPALATEASSAPPGFAGVGRTAWG
mmetsp:Transcript_12523/g.44342  ORF Transcript_12523/g.44342 Transcript_12523/m.44342 type:complete len:274 (+) Transcript_12523:1102-1923(+)